MNGKNVDCNRDGYRMPAPRNAFNYNTAKFCDPGIATPALQPVSAPK